MATANLPSSSTSDMFLTAESLGHTCDEAIDRMQLVAELLLLRSGSQPVATEPPSKSSASYSKCRDSLVATTKALAISIRDLSKALSGRELSALYGLVNKITEQVNTLTEAATQAAYLTSLKDPGCTPARPGVVDRYRFCRSRQTIRQAYNKFKPEAGHLSRSQTLDLSKSLADNLSVLTESCQKAGESKELEKQDRAQFASCAQALQGTTAAFLISLKSFASTHSQKERERILLFGRPVLETVDSVLEFTKSPQFSGQPATLSLRGRELQTEILGGAMAVVSSVVQLLGGTKSLLNKTQESSSNWQKVTLCCKATADAIKLLSSSIRAHTPVLHRRTTDSKTHH